METAQKKTVKELFNLDEADDFRYLIRFGTEQYLALRHQKNGRLDLVDAGCGDTGSDVSGWTYAQLEAEIANWLNCIETTEEEKDEAWEQVERA